jgi:uridine phosphorylase
MPYPNYPNKYLEEALFHPEDFLNYRRFKKKDFPKKYVITYQSSALRYFKRKFSGKYKIIKLHSNFPVYSLKGKNLGFVKMSGIGSPHAGTMFEELIGLGGKIFINIGTAGGLKNEGVFLCEKAIRDEGTSHHYFPNGKYAFPDKNLTEKLAGSFGKNLIKYEKAVTWTIDAPYRETKKEIAHYKKEGVATVEMEASALFSIAKYRKVKMAAAFVVSDVLVKKWNPKFHHLNIIKTQNKLIDSAIGCLSKLK